MYKLIALTWHGKFIEEVFYSCNPTLKQLHRFRMRVVAQTGQQVEVRSTRTVRSVERRYGEVS